MGLKKYRVCSSLNTSERGLPVTTSRNQEVGSFHENTHAPLLSMPCPAHVYLMGQSKQI